MKYNSIFLFHRLVLVCFLFSFWYDVIASTDNEVLIISEVADPSDVYKARFVELFNPNSGSLNFQTQTWFLCRQSNGSSWQSVQLTGSIAAGETYIVAYNEAQFISSYGFMPDLISGIVYGNGDDGYFLYKDGNYLSGTLVDSYGVIGQDGTGEAWEYEDSKATRKFDCISATASWKQSEWIIRHPTETSHFTPGIHRDTLRWNGSNSVDWNIISNWNAIASVNYFPDISQIVFIAVDAIHFPSIQDTGFCYKLILEANTNETAVISNHEKLQIDGEAIVNLYVSGGLHTKDDPNAIYHFISPPIESVDVIDVFPSTAYVRKWKEDMQQWESLHAGDNMYSGKAYSCWLEGGSSFVSFNGEFVNEDVAHEISYTTSVSNPAFSGYNLIGNPYPSSIDWDEGNWVKTNIDASIAIWSDDNGGYIYWNGSIGNITNGIIPPCQGFFIKANDILPSVVIPLDSRVAGNSGIYKDIISDCLSLKVEAKNSFSDETFISFNPNASFDFDSQFDAQKLFGLESAPNIYSRADDNSSLAINTIPAENQNQDVKIEFYSGIDGDFLLKAKGMDSFVDGIGIMLEDLKSGSYKDLRSDSIYNFSYYIGEDPFRFIIHFTGLTVLDELTEKAFDIIFTANKLKVCSIFNNANLSIYTLSGQKIHEQGICKGDNQIALNLSPGIYIVKLIHNNISHSKKIRIW